jgi:TRAP transporter TAXI family solute receptor
MRRQNTDGLDQSTSSSKLPLLSRRGILYVGLPILALVLLVTVGSQRVIHPAPTRIRMLSGPDGSSYRKNAEKYKKTIERFGVKVDVISTHGSLDNLRQLANPKAKVDVGFVQGGLTDGIDTSNLMSLGSVFAQPLMVYYRQTDPVERLSQLKGKRLAIGPEGSGARTLALKLLKANGMDVPPTTLLELAGEEAADGLIAGKIDAAFLMGDSATPEIMKKLRNNDDIEIANFRQADGYLRKFRFLSKLTLPEGAYDLGKNEPPRTLTLVGPTVELVARKDLHPALSDLLISAAKEIHSSPGLYRNAGEYPAPLARDFPISPDAERYYKSGGHFLYQKLPFWLANLIDRLIVVLVPLLVVVLPATKIVPNVYRWWMRSRIYKWYGALMTIERQVLTNPNAEEQLKLISRIDAIENAVNDMKTPVSFADQLYVLRDHVRSVRQQLLERIPGAKHDGATMAAPPA